MKTKLSIGQNLFEALERVCDFTALETDMFEIIDAVDKDNPTEWISVSPVEDGRYIVNIYEDEEIGDYVMEAEFRDGIWQSNGMIPIDGLVTHYQPLPTPPAK